MKPLNFFRWILSLALLFSPIILKASAPGFDGDTNDVPIDGGLSLLLAAGIGYGIRRKLKEEKIVEKK